MISSILSRLIILVFGTLYPAYRSYKAIKNKDVREYAKWMMYWVVFALFCSVEIFADVFLSWLPFYFECKIAFLFWLISPATKGSSILYRKFVHPLLNQREKEIDEFVEKAREQGYSTFLDLASRGFNIATTFILTTASKGQTYLGQRSLSMNDLMEPKRPESDRVLHPLNEDDEFEEDFETRLNEDRAFLEREQYHKITRSQTDFVLSSHLNNNGVRREAAVDAKSRESHHHVSEVSHAGVNGKAKPRKKKL